jgi:hypothetical protein
MKPFTCCFSGQITGSSECIETWVGLQFCNRQSREVGKGRARLLGVGRLATATEGQSEEIVAFVRFDAAELRANLCNIGSGGGNAKACAHQFKTISSLSARARHLRPIDTRAGSG